ncbi:MAG: hypothetical protein DHS20C16_08500 [Phycisphaerae bacterium]|nr:MAG: hypothetical protein DHS20C16_08500 [Phycisphaerae bacterium]
MNITRKTSSNLKRICFAAASIGLFAIALPVLAHCGKCAGDGLALAESLKAGKVSLAGATTLAEETTKGIAVRAITHKDENGSFVEVHCMIEDKIMAVRVDCTTGKASAPSEVTDLEAHAMASMTAADVDAAAGGTLLDATIESKLDGIAQATKEGELDNAEESLIRLEEKTNLSESLQAKVKSARSALDAAKSVADAKDGLPELP